MACGSWASFHSRPTAACHKMPVSSNVSHQSRKAVSTRNSALTPGLRMQMYAASANTKHKASTHQQWALPAGRSSQVGRWSALSASVLRRAVSQQGTAQERGAVPSVSAVSGQTTQLFVNQANGLARSKQRVNKEPIFCILYISARSGEAEICKVYR